MMNIDWWFTGLCGLWGLVVSLALEEKFTWWKWAVLFVFMNLSYLAGVLR